MLRRHQRAQEGHDAVERSEEQRLNSSHSSISYAVFCLKKKKLSNNIIYFRDRVELSQAFFNPALLKQTGIDNILKYAASIQSQEDDNQIVDSLRNFLFGAPGQGGLDLASLNIQRGRDHGLAD